MDCWVGEESVVDQPEDQPDQDLLHDAKRPLEDVSPVELVEVDDPGPEPPESWGQDGAGGDTP